MTAETAIAAPGELSHDDVLTLRALTVVAEGDEFIVGDPETKVYIVLPAIGVRVIELLREGRTLGDVTARARGAAGEEVDVASFAQSLWSSASRHAQAPSRRRGQARSQRRRAGCSPASHALPGQLYAASALAVIALFALRPNLFPRVSDIFFLDTPVRSLAALTLIAYTLAAAHEGCHWLAARAEGVSARITISRRLYFLALEIDLSGLWSLPRRRRYGPLLAGLAFDALVLLGLLVARSTSCSFGARLASSRPCRDRNSPRPTGATSRSRAGIAGSTCSASPRRPGSSSRSSSRRRCVS